jgi:hypothetical protein
MSLKTAQYTVGTTAVQVISPQNNPTQVLLHNAEKTTNHYIYLGGSSSVTTETGIHMDGSDNYKMVLQPGSSLWAIAANSYDLHVSWQVL